MKQSSTPQTRPATENRSQTGKPASVQKTPGTGAPPVYRPARSAVVAPSVYLPGPAAPLQPKSGAAAPPVYRPARPAVAAPSVYLPKPAAWLQPKSGTVAPLVYRPQPAVRELRALSGANPKPIPRAKQATVQRMM